ncbi:Signal peptidase I [hydrothermal vent metagenome]|uniref:signal peptidase I n=1 Tax=hydrothermal vent metagenome TaxID=652676 RepID=A0A3B1B820_9ZZZZ
MNIDFSLILVVAVFITGTIWLLDKFIVARSKKSDKIADGKQTVIGSAWNMLAEFSRFLFPVVFIVLFLRGFIAEPFRIPSGSMLPTLEIGDFILVNKFSYGIRLPAWNKKIIDIGTPQRGDVIVFRYPEDPSIDYIKRVVGVPGDKVAYYNKVLYINGKRMPQGKGTVYRPGYDYIVRKSENLAGVVHDVLDNKMYPARDFVITVPKHRYFVMGDNRDNSRDSRYWGFVPDENLVGHAMLVWFNWELGDWPRWTRIGTLID